MEVLGCKVNPYTSDWFTNVSVVLPPTLGTLRPRFSTKGPGRVNQGTGRQKPTTHRPSTLTNGSQYKRPENEEFKEGEKVYDGKGSWDLGEGLNTDAAATTEELN